MKIRDKLTLQYCAIVGLILIFFSCSIYYLSAVYRYNAFKNRLIEKALNTANLMFKVEQIDMDLLIELRKKHFQSLPEEFVQIYNHTNQLIFKEEKDTYFLSEEDLKKVREKGTIDFKLKERQFVALLYEKKYVVVASAMNFYGQEELDKLLYILLSINFLGLIVIFISGRMFAFHALSPISRMVEEVSKLSASNLSARLDEGKKKDEIAKLAITFNHMFNRIEDAFVRQKRFVANASHELRTPLTTITGEIEVALMKDRSIEDYKEVLVSVLEEAKTLTKLSNNLLKLAQAGELESIITEKIPIEEIFITLKEEQVKRYSGKILKLNTRFKSQETLWLTGNKELLKTALLNIIDNAFKFSDQKPVLVTLSVIKDQFYIEINDDGRGITDEEIDFVFQPFYRSENVLMVEGSGIGLSLSEKIIHLHQGEISIASTFGVGTSVTIKIPLSKSVN